MSTRFHFVSGLPCTGATPLRAILKKNRVLCRDDKPSVGIVFFSVVLLFFTPMFGTVVFAEPIGGIVEAKSPTHEVGPAELAGQLSKIASIPEFQLTKTAIERISGVRLETDGPPSQGKVEPGSEQSHFGPSERRPYEMSWDKTSTFTQFGFVWHDYGKKYLPFQRAPSGMCMQAKSLAESFVTAGWKLHYSARFFPLPPGDTYTRGEHGYLRLVFDSSTDCVIEVLLVATMMKWK